MAQYECGLEDPPPRLNFCDHVTDLPSSPSCHSWRPCLQPLQVGFWPQHSPEPALLQVVSELLGCKVKVSLHLWLCTPLPLGSWDL